MSEGQQQHIADTEAHPACYHCGDRCDGRDIAIGDKYFCCNGCKTVYEMLAERDLCDYYVIDEARRGKSPLDSGY